MGDFDYRSILVDSGIIVQCSPVQPSAFQNSPALSTTAKYCPVQSTTAHYCPTYSAVQLSAAQCSLLQPTSAQYSAVQLSAAHYTLVILILATLVNHNTKVTLAICHPGHPCPVQGSDMPSTAWSSF